LSTRKEEVAAIRAKFPTKVPIIVEKYKKERNLPHIDKVKFLVPQDLTLSQLSTILRNRLQISSTESFFLFVSGKCLPSLSTSVAELYRDHSDEDGFLYVSYASQEAFG
jgi:microtubule-associated protein 1 light chain